MGEAAALNRVLDRLEDAGTLLDPSAVLEGFCRWAEEGGRPLYAHQEEAAVEIFDGRHVIAATPTGSGKSLIGLAGHMCALARGDRSYYTAPLKALVSEKFFDLVEVFGARNVGMVTGDVSVNADAPIICATAEILANEALRTGPDADIGLVVMDEFHFYGDPQRGWAWQVPLLELTDTQMVLMSATLGNVDALVERMQQRSGRQVSVVADAIRPVPLEFDYVVEEAPRAIERLVDAGRWPIYLVHFSQREALERAQALASLSVISRPLRDKVAEAVAGFAFGAGFGKQLKRLLLAGVGVHHAGMLPRYRRLVEQLTQRGLLAVVCGTDTLGVGINVPIRTVVLTSLVKFDGRRMRHLSAREFHQIAGRAGRAGFDTVGYVDVLAPPAEVEHAKAEAKARNSGKRSPKRAAKKPGEVSWNRATFERLVGAEPEALRSQFDMTHAMVLNVLSGGRDAAEHLVWLARNNDDPQRPANPHLRRLADIYHSLVQAGVVSYVDSANAEGAGRMRLTQELPEDFALNQPLSPFALAALDLLDRDSPEYCLDVISVIEATLDDPLPLLVAQQRKARDAAYAKLREDRVGYDERQEILDEITWPKPLADMLEGAFRTYRSANPWVGDLEIAPKSVVRDMIENARTFSSLISYYDIARSEGVVLRYLTDAYRALRQVVPASALTDDLEEMTQWLGELVRSVDSSLLDEWSALASGQRTPAGEGEAGEERVFSQADKPLSSSPRFSAQVCQAVFARVELMARDDVDALAALGDPGWDEEAWDAVLGDYWDTYDWLSTDQRARSRRLCEIVTRPTPGDLIAWGADPDSPLLSRAEAGELWLVRQRLLDPEEALDWAMIVLVDLPASDAAGHAVVHTVAVGPMSDLS